MAIKLRSFFYYIRLVTHGAFLWIHAPLLSAHFRLVTHIIHAAGRFLYFSRAQDLVRNAGRAGEGWAALGRGGAEAERWCRLMRSPASAGQRGSGLRVAWVTSLLAAGIWRRGRERVRPHVCSCFFTIQGKTFSHFKKGVRVELPKR